MENIYSLGARFAALSEQYDELTDKLNAEYEENGGEITEQTEQMESEKDSLIQMRDEIMKDVLTLSDDYAAIVKNEEAKKKVMEAELKALKEEQAKVVAKYQARINRKTEKIAWFKQNIADAMNLAHVEKIGGPKTPNRFTIWFSNTASVLTDEERLIAPYKEEIESVSQSLPAWLVLKPSIIKSNMDKEALPEGAELKESKNLQIK